MRLSLSTLDLVRLDEMAIAQQTGATTSLDILDAGASRLRVGLTGAHGVPLSARRVYLPDDETADRWEEALNRQETANAAAGIACLPMGIHRVATPGRARTLWILRPRVPKALQIVRVLRGASPDTARQIASSLLDLAQDLESVEGAAACTQPSAWVWLDGELVLTHNDLPAVLPPRTLYGPWWWWSAWVPTAWIATGVPVTSDGAVLVASLLGPLGMDAALEGVLPTLSPLLGPDPRARVIEAATRQRRWARRVQSLRRPR